jgi:hypothetical protein
MYLCIRIDLDYVPWDTPDAEDFGHGEPAALLRLLDLARSDGVRFHFYASNRALRTFPTEAQAVLNEGHDLDWLCKHPDRFEGRFQEAHAVIEQMGHRLEGMATRAAWPEGLDLPSSHPLRFLSSPPGPAPAGMRHFPVETRPFREAMRAGQSPRAWTDATKTHLRQVASVRQSATVVLHPQALAKTDPKLAYTQEVINLARVAGLEPRTLRDVMGTDRQAT